MELETQTFLRLHSNHQQQVAGMLARAFFNDPLIIYYLPDPVRREQVLPYLMLVSLRYALYYGEVDTPAERIGAACWLQPGHTDLNLCGLIRSAIGVIPPNLGLEALRRINQIEPAIDRVHRACMPGPHWYLMLLAIEPSFQGQGIGGHLIERKLAEARQNGLPCYLETMTEKDVAFYRKHGFEVVFETEIHSGGLHVWMMSTKL